MIPIRALYRHLKCGHTTRIGSPQANAMAQNPTVYPELHCSHCEVYFPLTDSDGTHNFVWVPDGTPVGS